MAISARKVQNKKDANGVPTGKPGTVYDVNLKYNTPDGKKDLCQTWVFNKKRCGAA